jgi:hypothetical protein
MLETTQLNCSPLYRSPNKPATAMATLKRAGDPNGGEFSDAVALKKVPEDLSAL